MTRNRDGGSDAPPPPPPPRPPFGTDVLEEGD